MSVSIIRAKEILSHAFTVKQPVLLLGSPGIGKSDIVRALSAERGIGFIDLRLSQMSELDLRGVPSVTEGMTLWNVPSCFPRAGEGILFLDELTSALPTVQVAAYQLILDRAIGDYTLPDGWHIVAAGNKATDHAVTFRMSSALKNRFLTLEISSDLDAWLAWARKHNIAPEIIAFVSFRPELLNAFESDTFSPTANSFPTQRSWTFLSRFISLNLPQSTLLPIATGLVGSGAAAELMGFLDVYTDLPSYNDIVTTPSTVKFNTSVAALYAISSMLQMRAKLADMPSVHTFIARLPKEFQVITLRGCVERDVLFSTTPEFGVWASENSSVLF